MSKWGINGLIMEKNVLRFLSQSWLLMATMITLLANIPSSSGLTCYCHNEPNQSGFGLCYWAGEICTGDVCYVHRRLISGIIHTDWNCLEESNPDHHIDAICNRGALNTDTEVYACCRNGARCNEHLELVLPIELPQVSTTPEVAGSGLTPGSQPLLATTVEPTDGDLPETATSAPVPSPQTKLTIFAGISDRGVTVAGQSYTLTCHVTGFDNFTPNLSYKWTKYNGTLTHVSIDSKTLSFSPLKLSDAGNYVCHVIARSDVTNKKVANTSSQSFEVNIVVPEPTVTLHSNLPKLAPILSRSSFTLTCAVELIPAIDVPVTASTVWTGPDGRFIVPPTTAEMKSTTRYVSLKTLYSVESLDSGNYTCTIVIENGVKVSASTNIEIVDGIFQLKLTSVDICQKWYTKDSVEAEQYSHFIKEALVEAIEQKCKCHFPSTNLLDEDIFICEDSPNQMTYRNTLLGTHNFDGGRVIEFMQEWVGGGPLIRIGENYVKVDSSCPVAITSLYESTCQQKERSCLYGDDDPTHAILCAKHLANRNSTTAACIEGCMLRNG